MKRFIALFIVLLLFLTGCGTKTEKTSLPDFQYSYMDNAVRVCTQESDEGYYTVLNKFIIFTDKQTHKSTPLCNKPNCMHQSELDCSARLIDKDIANPEIQIYRNNIYYISNDDSGESEKINWKYLRKIPLDGSSRDTVLTFKDTGAFENFFVYDGYFYGLNQNVLYRASLDTGEQEKYIDFSDYSDTYGVYVNFINVYDGWLYMRIMGYLDKESYNTILGGGELNSDVKTRYDIVRYNLKNGKHEVINSSQDKEFYYLGISDGKIIGLYNRTLYQCDMNGKNLKKLFKAKNGTQLYCDDSYIFELDKDKLITYDKNGKRISTVTLDTKLTEHLETCTFNHDEILFDMEGEAEGIGLIRKKDILKDKTELKYEEIFKRGY